MANIFLAFSNAIIDESNREAMPCFYESLIMELVKLGNNILTFTHRQPCSEWEPIEKGLLNKIKEFNPDIIILCNNDFYNIHEYFSCPIVIYEVDSPKLYSNQKTLAGNSHRYKAVVSQMTSRNILINNYGFNNRSVICIPFFTSVQAEDITQNKNISFIGSKFTHAPVTTKINEFMAARPEPSEVERYKKAINKFVEQPFIDKAELAESVGIEPIDLAYRYLDLNELLWILSDSRRVQLLTNVADLGLYLYGTRNWISDILYEPSLTLSFQDRKVYSLKHNQEIYNSSKLCINVNHLQAKEGFSWRVADVMASNGCLVAEYRPDFARLFPTATIPTFHNRYEAREICKNLLNDHSLRKEIVRSCQHEVAEKCRFEKIWPSIEEFTGVVMRTENEGCCELLNMDKKGDSSYKDVDKLSGLRKVKYKLYRSIWKRLGRELREKGMI